MDMIDISDDVAYLLRKLDYDKVDIEGYIR